MNLSFTDEQMAVIQHDDGHAAVSAVAGSGKTSVLVERIARLRRHGVSARSIIVVQFNKSAQLNFGAALAERLNSSTAPDVRTFHSIGLGLCKRLVAQGHLTPAKVTNNVYRAQVMALRRAWMANQRNNERPNAEIEQAFVDFVGQVKAQIEPVEVFFKIGNFPADWQPFIEAFKDFEAFRIKARLRTFDDMCWEPVMRMKDQPDLWTQFQMFDHVLVDEAQDVSPVQYEIVRGIAGDRANVMLVGDDDQSIYGWRGARHDILLHQFPRDFAPCARYPMTRTFRFGDAVALMASQVITVNQDRTDKITIAHSSTPDTTIRRLPQRTGQDSGLVDELLPLKSQGRLHEVMILSRYTLDSIAYELELIQAGIPYFFYGRAATMHVPELAGLIGALAIASGYWPVSMDERGPFLAAMLTVPPIYLSAEDIGNVVDEMVPMTESNSDRIFEPLARLAERLRVDQHASAGRVADRVQAIRLLASGALRNQSPDTVLGTWVQVVNLEDFLSKGRNRPNAGEGIGGNTAQTQTIVQDFRRLAKGHGSSRELLEHLGPMAGKVAEHPPNEDHVRIRTIHGAKGLQSDRVYVLGLARGQFPSPYSRDEEEERRLAYVALTRVRKELVLMHPDDPTLEGQLADLSTLADGPRKASDYLFDGDIGLSVALAKQIRSMNADTRTIDCRDARVANRYLKEAGVGHIKLKAAAATRRRRITPRDTIRPGMKVWIERLGNCVAVSKIYDSVWWVQPHGGERAMETLTNAGWLDV